MFNSADEELRMVTLRTRLSFYGNSSAITLEEFDFMFHRMTNGKFPNSGFGTLPYVTPTEKALADSIAKKLNFNKFYRGPRCASDPGRSYSQPCRTWKENATGVALYIKP